MKIALPSHNNNIDDHFGHCEYYTLFTVDTQSKKITDTEILKSPDGCGCKSNIASTLSDKGVKVMLAGNMGEGAIRVLNNAGIQVLRGCSGDVKTVASRWLEGSIADSGELCHVHECDN